MNSLNKENVVYSIQTFLMFLNIAKKNEQQSAEAVESCREKGLILAEKLIAGHIDPLMAIFQLNRLIGQVNQILKAPYPTLMTETAESIVKGEIVAFEHYLNQELKAHHLTLQEEAPLFNESMLLWEKVGVTLSAQESATEFAALVEKLNTLLPQDEQYPSPDKDV